MKKSIGTNPLLFLFALLISYTSIAAPGERKVNLRGSWKFNPGDNIAYAKPDYNDSNWEEIYVPSIWQEEGFRRYHGYAWYRTTFTIEFTDKESLFLELGRIDDVDEVFINGKKIGATGGFPPDYFTAYNVPRSYPIPVEYLSKTKKNVIAVRIYDEGGEGGILGREIGIYNHGTYSESGFMLTGNWKFHLSDDMKWAAENWNDSDWENVVVPASWESQGFRQYDGFAWYRKKFTLPANFKTTEMVALLGKIDDMDEVYLNGKLIGSTGKVDRQWARDDEWQRPRNYFIPEGLLKPGKENVIAVRVFDQTGNGGIYEGPVTIIPVTEYKQFWRKYQYENRHYSSSFWSFLEW